MMNKITPLIEFKNVSKEFFLQEDRTFKELIPTLLSGKGWAKKHIVFNNLDFSVKKGESIGIVGENGAGKSTIMKLIAGVTYPTNGKVKTAGKIAPLIELGAGFHHELSGYENIFLNAAILGMHKKEIDMVIDDIIDFSELDEFLHTPIKKYSTGMLMRLAFSIAIHAPADIYLIDEVLAVGDRKFQKKCLKRLREFKNHKDKIIVFISHSEKDVKNFCDRAILLNEGKMIMDSSPDEVFRKYNSL
jgi:ABC-2 type transport system ATP-binding protein